MTNLRYCFNIKNLHLNCKPWYNTKVKDGYMKKYYKINEIAKLYNIKTDSLRYYEEVGLISPMRSQSNYRLYTLKDIYILNIIRDCLKLGYDTHQIKDYLDNRSVNNTIVFLKEEEKLIQKQIRELNVTLNSIQTRIASLDYTKHIQFNTFQVESFPKRYCRYLKEKIDQDEKIDFLLTKLTESMEEDISVLGNMDSGSIVEYKNDEYVYTSVFVLTQEEKYDFILEEGLYCTYTYTGEYDRTNQIFYKMKDWITDHNYTIEGPFLEFLLIDIHETKKVEEYITSIHVKVKPR